MKKPKKNWIISWLFWKFIGYTSLNVGYTWDLLFIGGGFWEISGFGDLEEIEIFGKVFGRKEFGEINGNLGKFIFPIFPSLGDGVFYFDSFI